MKIAVLLTCHNRREKTVSCLRALFQTVGLGALQVRCFLVDDGSTDDTGEAVARLFPDVRIIKGSGSLFWNGGMHLAWQHAAKEACDAFLWLNDDTLLEPGGLRQLLSDWERLGSDGLVIVAGACRSAQSGQFTYGGRIGEIPVIPDGTPRDCTHINGNVVLIPWAVYEKIGNLDPRFTHTMGDIDYGLRAIKAGIRVVTTSGWVGTCERNPPDRWSDPALPLATRWRLFHSPKGLNVREYLYFRRKHEGGKWLLYAVKAYAKVLAPRLFDRLKRSAGVSSF